MVVQISTHYNQNACNASLNKQCGIILRFTKKSCDKQAYLEHNCLSYSFKRVHILVYFLLGSCLLALLNENIDMH